MISLSELNIYPVKSMSGISLSSCHVDAMGLQYDRRWMLVSPKGKFITQRSHPQMALVQPQLNNDQLTLTSFGLEDHIVPEISEDSSNMTVQVWSDTVQAKHVSSDTDKWLEQTIGEPCHLVYIPDDEVRQCDLRYAQQGDITGFADGFPLLLVSQASLDDLNSKLEKPITMKHFRPNLVVTGCNAFAEDTWKEIQINSLNFRLVKPCSRCTITTVNPNTGISNDSEPLQTLATYRKQGDKILFGQNMIHNSTGILTLGDSVYTQITPIPTNK